MKELISEFEKMFEDFNNLNINSTENVNIFKILNIERTEIRHSRFLAWLLDPKGTHDLNDLILKRFLQKISDTNKDIRFDKNLNYNSFEVQTEVKIEKGYIDILLASKEEKIVIVIENKIESNQHEVGDSGKTQTEFYREKIEKIYKSEGDNKYTCKYIYLSEQGEKTPSNEWIDIDYQVIYDILNEVLENERLKIPVKQLIENYLEILKTTDYVEDKKFNDACTEFFKRYKDCWKIIETKANIDKDVKYLYDEIKNYLSNENKINLFFQNKHWLSFNTKDLRKVCETEENDIFWSIGFLNNRDEIPIYIEIQSNDTKIVKKLKKRLKEIYGISTKCKNLINVYIDRNDLSRTKNEVINEINKIINDNRLNKIRKEH